MTKADIAPTPFNSYDPSSLNGSPVRHVAKFWQNRVWRNTTTIPCFRRCSVVDEPSKNWWTSANVQVPPGEPSLPKISFLLPALWARVLRRVIRPRKSPTKACRVWSCLARYRSNPRAPSTPPQNPCNKALQHINTSSCCIPSPERLRWPRPEKTHLAFKQHCERRPGTQALFCFTHTHTDAW